MKKQTISLLLCIILLSGVTSAFSEDYSTNKYKAWADSQSVMEPYDYYQTLVHALSDLEEGEKLGMRHTERYKTAYKLLIPISITKKELPNYIKKTLKRYIQVGNAGIWNILSDMGKAKILTKNKDGGYSISLNIAKDIAKVASELNLTVDVTYFTLLGLSDVLIDESFAINFCDALQQYMNPKKTQ